MTRLRQFINGMRWILLVVFGASLWNAGCHRNAITEEEQFKTLFDGYQLVAVDNLPPNRSIDDIDTAVLHGAYPLEPKLIPGRAYVLRKVNRVSNEILALKVFPKRLSIIGARITKAPRSPQDLMYLYVGGPLFKIEFEKDGHQGEVLNRVNATGKDGEQGEVLILVYR